MELLHRRCCGLDVHKETVVACLRLVADGKVTTEVRTFQTITSDLLRLSEWLAANECTHIAMEATGVYWKPVWHILDDGEFALVLVNAAHVKNVPGRKTDVNDAMWLAESERGDVLATDGRLFCRHGFRYRLVRCRAVKQARRSTAQPEEEHRHDQVGDRDSRRDRDADGFTVHKAEERQHSAAEGECGRFRKLLVDDERANGAKHQPRKDGATAQRLQAA